MKQSIPGGYYDALHTTTTEYNCLSGGREWVNDPDDVAQTVSVPGTLRNLRIELNDVPGTGTYVFSLYRAVGTGAWGVTTLTCTVAADGTVASDTEHDVSVAAGDVICLQCNPDSPDNARYARCSIDFEGDNANESLMLVHSAGYSFADSYAGVNGYVIETDENYTRQVCPTAGKIKCLHVQLETDPGTPPDAYRIVLRINGADSDDGGGNALECTIVANDRTGNDTTHEITVAAGDVLTLHIERIDSPSNSPQISIGMAFVADTDGESIISGGKNETLSRSATRYNVLASASDMPWTATEAQCYSLLGACTLKKLYFLLTAAPGAGNKYTFSVRVNSADPGSGLSVVVADAATTGNDTTNTVTVAAGDDVNLKSVPDSIPDSAQAHWGMVCYIAVVAVGVPAQAMHLMRMRRE